MEISIDYTKSAQKNAEEYFAMSKKARKKAEGAEKAVKDLEEKLQKIGKEAVIKRAIRRIRAREWYERFNWFYTSSRLLVIGGRSADQNEELNSKYFLDEDLFFHADIFGASVVILKGGEEAGREIKEEAAQLAASFSKAWENGQTSADVYSLRREQVTKSRNRGALGKGSFLLVGDREWYKGTRLGLCAFLEDKKREGLCIAPALTANKLGLKHYVLISIGNTKKSDAAKFIAKKLGYGDIDYIMQHLPAGSFYLKEVDLQRQV